MKKTAEIWDIVVVGGGPAGMMAAGRAAEKAREDGREIKILILEKNESLGKKLLITGGGRCNVTNAESDVRTLLSKFKDSDRFLFSAFSHYGVKETLNFFHTHNMPTKEEAEKRVFPASNTAQSVWDVLVKYIKSAGVIVYPNSPVVGCNTSKHVDGRIDSVTLKNGNKIFGQTFIFAVGGTSHPETGSTGEGFAWLAQLGHRIVAPSAALVPLTIKDSWVKKLAGVSLSDVKISVLQNNVKQLVKKGRLLFTHVGITGPTILNMSVDIRELLKYGETFISLDLSPSHDFSTLNSALQELFKKEHRKKIKNILSPLVPTALGPIILERAHISPDTPANSITRDQRIALMNVIKDLRMEIKGLLGIDKAIITSGGAALDEIDFNTMRSRIVPNLHIIGDMLDIDRPSGGYSLQLCWTTGWVAGNSVNDIHSAHNVHKL
jgi:predicted Rossmann fold flavoprotein